ncbi:unnamed protein product [Diatraea saccharalis]|uniref:Peptidase aspartic putative domain-containing protein n=1 Tax=Diatraea saccharalis TaxID=40085 RepID=A0A9N9R1D8_9NEOP|nr:unnamed protein product [Diatraea saccharalis]
MSQIEILNNIIIDNLIENEVTEDEITKELESAERYKAEFILAELEFTRFSSRPEHSETTSKMTVKNGSTKVRLPKIELFKFDGDLENWLRFWSQFKKIHHDEELTGDDKFHYLLQSMMPGSRASDLVHSFPPTSENYEKVIESLKSRFGKTDLLVEVYIRKLLQLVVQSNIYKSQKKFQVTSLYDKLESHLRSLESLNVSKEACAPMLFPLVESSLPEELLRVWQRHCGPIPEPKDQLRKLMEFLQVEAENEERIAMATRGFTQNSATEFKGKKANAIIEENTPTASGLIAGDTKTVVCIFCDEDHDSSTCMKAKKMTLEERQNVVKNKRCCFRCLKVGHGFRKCRNNKKCPWCGRKHVLLMCREAASPSTSQSAHIEEKNDLVKSTANISVHQNVFLQTLRVKLQNKEKTMVVRCILDSGSQHSYILKDVAIRMNYESHSKTIIQHGLFGGSTSIPETHNKFIISVQNLTTSFKCDIEVFDKKEICADIPAINDKVLLEKLKQMNIILSDVEESSEPISILIGSDMMAKLVTCSMTQINEYMSAIETKLGWTLLGKRNTFVRKNDATFLVVSLFAREGNISDLWRLDTLGIMDPIEKKSKEMHVKQVKENFKETTVFNKDVEKYEVVLPWKDNHPPLPSNREISFKRLEKVTKRLKFENYFEQYGQVFKDWYNEGIIEKVNDDEVSRVDSHYLPHRHVIRLSSSTTPIRPVFDASARSVGSPSLNQCLETGPNLIELIPNILLRFREKEIGVISDIRKAFLQISISPKDRDLLRFMWWDSNNPDKLQIYRHCRVVFGLTCSPFLLEATLEHHIQQVIKGIDSYEDKMTLGKLLKSFYVDNSVTSVSTMKELDCFRNKAIAVLKTGGFDLRCWEYSGDNISPHVTNVLGLNWNKQTDTLFLTSLEISDNSVQVTKRFILSITHKIFDVLGLVCPILIKPKLLLRDLCNSGYDWDMEVPKDVEMTFSEWYSQLNLLNKIELPRCLLGKYDRLSFHVFVDASQSAYAAVIFVRIETIDGIDVRFVQAKSRISPKSKKSTSIPRLELLAASIGARLMKSVSDALSLTDDSSVFYWSDSNVVLSWIKRDAPWARFVFNRVKEIREISKPEQWFFVPGCNNPADLPSRGCDVEFLIHSKWWEGPLWLREAPDNWSNHSSGSFVDEAEVNRELKKTEKPVTNSQISSVFCSQVDSELSRYTRYFSSYNKLVRMVAWMLRFIKKCRKMTHQLLSDDISGLEYQDAEITLLKLCQQETFSGVSDFRLKGFRVLKDDKGLLRLESPLLNKSDAYCFRCPIILYPNHIIVTRLIEYEHKKKSTHWGSDAFEFIKRKLLDY